MAKLRSIFNIEGTLGEMTFYKQKSGNYFIKQKGGVSKERIDTDPAYARTKENGEEFGSVATSGKILRKGGSMLISRAKDPSLTRRLVSVFAKVKKLDSESERGKRNVYNGLLTEEGRALLKGFDFNAKANFSSILRCPFELDVPTGHFKIEGLVPKTMLQYPEHATHVTFRTGLMRVDFVLGETDMKYSKEETMALDMSVNILDLIPSELPTGDGFIFWLLLIEFSQEVNGKPYPLHNGLYNVLHLLDVH